MTITIVHGAQGVGKSTIAPALARHFRSTCVVDEWDGRAKLPAGAPLSRCRCEQCCPDEPAPTWTRAHLRACLFRWLAALPPREREEWLKEHARLHGEPARMALVKAVDRFRGLG